MIKWIMCRIRLAWHNRGFCPIPGCLAIFAGFHGVFGVETEGRIFLSEVVTGFDNVIYSLLTLYSREIHPSQAQIVPEDPECELLRRSKSTFQYINSFRIISRFSQTYLKNKVCDLFCNLELFSKKKIEQIFSVSPISLYFTPTVGLRNPDWLKSAGGEDAFIIHTLAECVTDFYKFGIVNNAFYNVKLEIEVL